ncbi:MAG TPA: integrin alpha, partial [Chitinophagaceae bacterium]
MKPIVRPIVMVSVSCLVLAAIAKQLCRDTVSSPLSGDINTTNMPVSRVWQTGFPLPAARHKPPVSPADRPDTQQLKQSAWFSIISRQIEQDLYHFHGQAGVQQLQSENREQSITGTYSYNYMQLAPMYGTPSALPVTKKNKTAGNDKDWDLALRLKDIAFDGRPCYYPLKNASVQQHDSSLVFDHAGAFAVQYLNTAEGVRQNFIIRRAPAGMQPAASIRVHMAVQSTLRAYAVAGGKELHFAHRDNTTGGLRNELSYTGLKAWDANGHELAANMEPGNNGKEITIQVAAADAVYPITIDPLSTTIATTLNGASNGDNFGYSLSSAGDVNGDGFSDVIVGTGAANKAYA